MSGSRIPYNAKLVIGAQVAEVVSDTIKLKAKAARMYENLNAITGGGATPVVTNLETPNDTTDIAVVPNGAAAALGAGSVLYYVVRNIADALSTITAADLAKLDQG